MSDDPSATTPPTPAKPGPGREPATLAEAMEAIPYEPLLPVEKKLIIGSLVLGFALLGLLMWASNAYFPVPAPPAAPAG